MLQLIVVALAETHLLAPLARAPTLGLPLCLEALLVRPICTNLLARSSRLRTMMGDAPVLY